MVRHRMMVRAVRGGVFTFTVGAGAALAWADRTETFDFVTPVNVGGALPRTVVDWDYFLGTEFDTPLKVGAITGKPNAVVIPEVKAFGAIIIPEVRADTRTGVRLSGDVHGRTGIDLHAGFDSGGVDAAASFQFGPTLTMPDTIKTGEFFDMRGSVGMSGGTNFNVDLPSVNAGADLVFELGFDGKAEAGLFPFVPYRVGPWGFDLDIDFSLFNLDFDLNLPEFPDFTFFDLPIPELADATGDVFRKQISVQPRQKNPDGTTTPVPGSRIDVGEVQLVKPVGANVKVTKNTQADGFDYTVDADLLRLGIDIDGLVTAALSGNSFTRQEFEVGGIGKLIAELVDVKYGPELGMEIHSNVTPYLNAELTFDGAVVVQEEGGLRIVSPGETLSVRWDQIPQIAVLGDSPVNVDVDFTQMQALMSQTGQLTLTDYMELRVLELIAQVKVGKLNVTLADIGPLIHKRFSILGDLLGELKIPVWQTDFDPVTIGLPDEILNTMHAFTLTPTPTKKVYLSGTEFDARDPSLFLTLQDGTVPTTLSDKTLVIGMGDGTQRSTGQLAPVDVVDEGTKLTLVTPPNIFDPVGSIRVVDDARITIPVGGIEVIEGSSYRLEGARDYQLSRIHNDGEFVGAGYLELHSAGGILTLDGSGLMRFDHPVEITADLLINGPGHTLLLEEPTSKIVYDVTHFGIQTEIGRSYHKLIGVDAIHNSGNFIIDKVNRNGDSFVWGFDLSMSTGLTNTATAQFVLRNNSTMQLNTPLIDNQGVIEVADPGSKLTLNRSSMTVRDTAGTGRFVARNGGLIEFTGTGGLAIDDHAEFHADGGTVRFVGKLFPELGSKVNLITEAGGTIALNGIDFGQISDFQLDTFKPGVNIVNRGLLDVQSGKNLLFVKSSANSPTGGGVSSVIKPINLVNEGTVRIHGGAQFGFEIEITDYAEGGATLAGGTWELIGATPSGTFFTNTTPIASANAAQTAVLETAVTKITNNGNVLGGSYDIENFDTALVHNAANVVLSGQALFPYFNTLADNQGSLALKNKHRFITAGDLRNSGQITVEGNSRLDVSGDLVIDEGSVLVEQGSILSATGTVEVIGGTFIFIRDAGPLNINSPWVVREKWVGLDEEGNDIILPALAEYPNNTFPTLNTAADVTIAGKQARFQPLDGLSLIHGRLQITEGNEFSLDHNLTVSSTGHLIVDASGKVFVDGSLTSSGELTVGDQSYLQANAITLLGGTVNLDGVIDAPTVTANPGVTVTGAGTFSGDFINNGSFNPGNSPGLAEIFHDYTQAHDATLGIEIAGIAGAGVDPDGHDQVRVEGTAFLDGILNISLIDGFFPEYGDRFEILSANEFDGAFSEMTGDVLRLGDSNTALVPVFDVDGPGPDTLTLVAAALGDLNLDGTVNIGDFLVFQNHFNEAGDWFDGDFNGDHMVNIGDFLLLQNNFNETFFGSSPAGSPDDLAILEHFAQSIQTPEPGTAMVLGLGAVMVLRHRRYRTAG